jgi:hypothetical protein
MKLTAKIVPNSSVVGSSVAFHDEKGAVAALCIITVPNPTFDYEEIAIPLAQQIAAAFPKSK